MFDIHERFIHQQASWDDIQRFTRHSRHPKSPEVNLSEEQFFYTLEYIEDNWESLAKYRRGSTAAHGQIFDKIWNHLNEKYAGKIDLSNDHYIIIIDLIASKLGLTGENE